jgi:hypothetical protein
MCALLCFLRSVSFSDAGVFDGVIARWISRLDFSVILVSD